MDGRQHFTPWNSRQDFTDKPFDIIPHHIKEIHLAVLDEAVCLDLGFSDVRNGSEILLDSTPRLLGFLIFSRNFLIFGGSFVILGRSFLVCRTGVILVYIWLLRHNDMLFARGGFKSLYMGCGAT